MQISGNYQSYGIFSVQNNNTQKAKQRQNIENSHEYEKQQPPSVQQTKKPEESRLPDPPSYNLNDWMITRYAGNEAPAANTNSQGIADAVEENLNWFSSAARSQDARYPIRSGTGEAFEWDFFGMPSEDPNIMYLVDKNGQVTVLGHNTLENNPIEKRLSAEEYQKAKEDTFTKHLMAKLESTLEKYGIELSEGEEFNISVDKYCKVSVTGIDREKAKAIEDVLNSMPDGKNWGLILNQSGISDVNGFIPQSFKMFMANYIESASGGTVTLDDLYLKDGKIMGLPPELDNLINSIEPDPYYDAKRIIEEDAALKKELGIPVSVEEELGKFIQKNPNQKSYDVKTMLTELLTTGVNNTPDMTANVVIGNGKLAFG